MAHVLHSMCIIYVQFVIGTLSGLIHYDKKACDAFLGSCREVERTINPALFVQMRALVRVCRLGPLGTNPRIFLIASPFKGKPETYLALISHKASFFIYFFLNVFIDFHGLQYSVQQISYKSGQSIMNGGGGGGGEVTII